MSFFPEPKDVDPLVLKSRALACLVDNYSILFQCDQFLDRIPKELLKELFIGVTRKGGILQVPLLSRIVDNRITTLDLGSVSGVDNTVAGILQECSGLELLRINEVVADSDALATMLSRMTKLVSLEINECHAFTDAVLSVVMEKCPCLENLVATRTSLSDKGVEMLFSTCWHFTIMRK